MNKMQAQQLEFKTKLNGSDDLNICYRLIQEEADELLIGLSFYRRHNDPERLPSIVDGMCDLIYVVFHLANAMKIDLEPYYDEVHRANLMKEPGDGTHKIRKPEGWQGPQIAEMLAQGVGRLV